MLQKFVTSQYLKTRVFRLGYHLVKTTSSSEVCFCWNCTTKRQADRQSLLPHQWLVYVYH